MPCSHCRQSGHNITTCDLVGLQVGGGPTQRSITADEMTRVSSCVKIQRAWRLYKPEHICSICISGIDKEKDNCVTKCGHKFCFTCLASNLPHRQTCPLCRAPLVHDFPVVVVNTGQEIDDAYTEGLNDGREDTMTHTRQLVANGYGRGLIDGRENTMAHARQLVEEREEIAYGRGLLDGRAIKEDELDDAKAEITRLKFQVENLRCDHRNMVKNLCSDYKLHRDDLCEKIKHLKTHNISISMNLRKRLTDITDMPHTPKSCNED